MDPAGLTVAPVVPLPSPGHAVGGFAIRSPTLPPASHTNAWWVGGPGGLLLDPGCADETTLGGLRAALDPDPPAAILLTHHHIDHVAGAAALARGLGLPIWAHPATAARVPFAVDRTLEDGEELEIGDRSWEVLHTPGHAPGHLCLRHGELLLAGDMVAGVGTILIEPEDGDLDQYLASLERLARSGAGRLLPAHGPWIDDGPRALRALVAHRHARSSRILAGLEAGPASAEQLVAAAYAELGPMVGEPAFRAIAARQILSHLRWLRARGQVRGPARADPGEPWERT